MLVVLLQAVLVQQDKAMTVDLEFTEVLFLLVAVAELELLVAMVQERLVAMAVTVLHLALQELR
jgi:hypothetical protein